MQIKKLLSIVLIISSSFCCLASANGTDSLNILRKQMGYKLEQKDYNGILKSVSEALNIKPDYRYAYHYYGIANFYLNRYANALYGFTEVLRLDSRTAVTYSNRGGVYAYLGYDKHALMDFDTALEMTDEDPILYINRSNIFINHGSFEEAENDLDTAEKYLNSPPSAEMYCNRAAIESYKGNYERALYFCNLALEANPEYTIGIQSKLEAIDLIGTENEKVEYANQAIEILVEKVKYNPSDYNSLYTFGVAQIMINNMKEAIRNLQISAILLNQQIALFPDSYTLIFQRGCIYQMIGDVVKAKEDFERVKEINPEYPPLKEKLEQVS